jgi:hypothetical protein
MCILGIFICVNLINLNRIEGMEDNITRGGGGGSSGGGGGSNGNNTYSGSTCEQERDNLKLLAKYLTLLIRKNEAEQELFTLQTGKRQVFNSPRLVMLNQQLTIFKKKVRDNKEALKFFNDNLDILV